MSTDEQMKKIGERIRAARARLNGSGNVANPHAVIDELKKAAEEYTTDLEKYNVRTANGFKIQWSGLYSNHDIQVAFLVGAAHALRWIPVSERLPELEQVCIWLDVGDKAQLYYGAIENDDIIDWYRDYTHWMVAPPAPKEEK